MEWVELDARGLSCPLPVLKARKRLRKLAPGSRLLVLATDPKAPRDFVHFCESSGHRLVRSEEEAGIYRILLERADDGR
ncbi:MAG TPA: sulfurtransferase TusA family protein [Rhodospirillales bacterium]|nr:sulfurtransferase TusA family protein [Rhodospirillales bacterium]